MKALDDFLHYRMIDVSSIKELSRRWFPRIYFGQPAKGLAHRALADIIESIEELAYYRRTMFVAPPGPTSAEIEAAVPVRTIWPTGTVIRRRIDRPRPRQRPRGDDDPGSTALPLD